MKQRFSSKATSINRDKLPRAYRYELPAGAVVVDYGCGQYIDHLKQNAESRGVVWYGYDKFNRTAAENADALNVIKNGSADYVLCSNVLNVIYADEVVNEIITAAVQAAKIETVFTIYEGNGSGVGKQTGPDQWQRNEKRNAYIARINALGYKCRRRGEFIIASK